MVLNPGGLIARCFFWRSPINFSFQIELILMVKIEEYFIHSSLTTIRMVTSFWTAFPTKLCIIHNHLCFPQQNYCRFNIQLMTWTFSYVLLHWSYLTVHRRLIVLKFWIVILHGPKIKVLVVYKFMAVGYCYPCISSSWKHMLECSDAKHFCWICNWWGHF